MHSFACLPSKMKVRYVIAILKASIKRSLPWRRQHIAIQQAVRVETALATHNFMPGSNDDSVAVFEIIMQ